MGPTLSKKEIDRQIKELRAKIGDSKDGIKAEFRSFRKVSKNFVKATAEYNKAKAAYDKKPKAKQERKLDLSLDKFYKANDDYKEVYKLIDAYFVSIEQDYNEICDLLDVRGSHRKAEKVANEFEKYKDWLEKKLAIISALIHSPKLLIMDEPFVGLDPRASFLLKEEMRAMCNQGCAIFFSTHVLDVAEKICDKIAIIKDGRLVVSGEMAEVKGDKSLESIFLELEDKDSSFGKDWENA